MLKIRKAIWFEYKGVTLRVGLSLLAPSYVGELKHAVQSLTQASYGLKGRGKKLEVRC